MTFDLYVDVSSLDVSFAHFLTGLWKRVLLRSLFLFFFIRRLHLEYFSSDESDEFDEEEYDKLGSKSGSAGTFGTGLGGLFSGVGFPLGVTLYDYESCNGDGGSLAIP